ncbi:MAG TPA: hypothetical protein VMS08_00590 [Candidatus Saccharimonadia bacterium]|jgi:hypothetical protein|nr:hypothetical protein [Candidatus Saccharimonadia bacterium]
MNRIAPDPKLQPWIEYLAYGRNAKLERQLIEKSREPDILKFTPNDAGKRFGDQASLEQWLRSGRELLWLVGPDNDLAGIVWYAPKPFPLDITTPENPTDTFGVRLYHGYAGKSLAIPALEQSLYLEAGRRKSRGEVVPSIWGETDTDNPAALATYTRIGYRPVDTSNGRTTLILSAQRIEEIIARQRSSKTIKIGESA